MKSSTSINTRNYYFHFYNKKGELIEGIKWTNKILEIHANRILKSVLPDEIDSINEPWFELKPCLDPDKKLTRAKLPVGFTSLTGKEYDPTNNKSLQLEWKADSEIQFFTIIIYDTEKEIFKGDYSVDDLFKCAADNIWKILQNSKFKTSDDLAPFYYEISLKGKDVKYRTVEISVINSDFSFEAHNPEGVFHLPKLEEDRERITFTKVAVEKIKELPKQFKKKLKIKGERGTQKKGRVILHQHVYDSMVKGLELSRSVEMGGYLLGNVYRTPESTDDELSDDLKWIIEITDVIKAKGTYGNPARLLFTHDSWSNIKRLIDDKYKNKKLVSWFHTHVFEATDTFGLSGLDQDLHKQFFSKPWQVALLLNINKKGERELRCFQRDDHDIRLVESTYEIYSS